MIQRIQSVFLLLAAICAIVFLFLPSIEINDVFISVQSNLQLLIPVILAAVVGFAAIFLFNNRALQTKLVILAALVVLVIIGLAVYLELSDGDFAAQYGIAFPPLALIFNLLAIRGIKNDEKLIRSMDRLR